MDKVEIDSTPAPPYPGDVRTYTLIVPDNGILEAAAWSASSISMRDILSHAPKYARVYWYIRDSIRVYVTTDADVDYAVKDMTWRKVPVDFYADPEFHCCCC